MFQSPPRQAALLRKPSALPSRLAATSVEVEPAIRASRRAPRRCGRRPRLRPGARRSGLSPRGLTLRHLLPLRSVPPRSCHCHPAGTATEQPLASRRPSRRQMEQPRLTPAAALRSCALRPPGHAGACGPASGGPPRAASSPSARSSRCHRPPRRRWFQRHPRRHRHRRHRRRHRHRHRAPASGRGMGSGCPAGRSRGAGSRSGTGRGCRCRCCTAGAWAWAWAAAGPGSMRCRNVDREGGPRLDRLAVEVLHEVVVPDDGRPLPAVTGQPTDAEQRLHARRRRERQGLGGTSTADSQPLPDSAAC